MRLIKPVDYPAVVVVVAVGAAVVVVVVVVDVVVVVVEVVVDVVDVVVDVVVVVPKAPSACQTASMSLATIASGDTLYPLVLSDLKMRF